MSVSKDRGGTLCPPLDIFGLGGFRAPILFGNALLWNDLPFSKGSTKFGYPEHSKIMFDIRNVLLVERRLTQSVRVPPYKNCGISDELYFFCRNEIVSWGKKHTALFQTHNLEKFFSTPVLVFARLYANTQQGGKIG